MAFCSLRGTIDNDEEDPRHHSLPVIRILIPDLSCNAEKSTSLAGKSFH